MNAEPDWREIAAELAEALRAAHSYTPEWTPSWKRSRDALRRYEDARES